MGDRGVRDKEMRRCWVVQWKTGQVLRFQFGRGKDFRPQQKIRSSLDLWPVNGNFATFLKG